MTFDESKLKNPQHAHDEYHSCCDQACSDHGCSDQDACASTEHLEKAVKPEANDWDTKIDREPPKSCNSSDTCGSAEVIREEEFKLMAELEKAHKKTAELNDRLLRLHAEMENQRKINKRELEKAHKFAIDKLVIDLVPIKDSLDIGVATGKANPTNGKAILEGLELIQKMLGQVLTNNHVEQISPLGEKFDPELHDALSMLNSDEYEPGVIMSVFQSGFVLNGRPIRPARVIVSRGTPAQESNEPN